MAAFGGSAPLSRPDLPNAFFGPCFDGGYLKYWGPTFSPLTGFDSRCYRIVTFTLIERKQKGEAIIKEYNLRVLSLLTCLVVYHP